MILLQNIPWLVLLVVLPLLGSMLCFLLPQRVKWLGLMTALAITASVLALSYQVVGRTIRYKSLCRWPEPVDADGDRTGWPGYQYLFQRLFQSRIF